MVAVVAAYRHSAFGQHLLEHWIVVASSACGTDLALQHGAVPVGPAASSSLDLADFAFGSVLGYSVSEVTQFAVVLASWLAVAEDSFGLPLFEGSLAFDLVLVHELPFEHGVVASAELVVAVVDSSEPYSSVVWLACSSWECLAYFLVVDWLV